MPLNLTSKGTSSPLAIVLGILLLSYSFLQTTSGLIDCGCGCCPTTSTKSYKTTFWVMEKYKTFSTPKNSEICEYFGCSIGRKPIFLDLYFLGILLIITGVKTRFKKLFV
jgi:hypothetical protein